jgi:hypothetical protein
MLRASPTETSKNVHGGHSLCRLDAATDGRKGMNQMSKKKEPILFNGRLGWITVLCEKCGIEYDIREVDNETTHPAALHVARFDCPKGHSCEARRVWNSYDDCLPDEWRDIVKSQGWGLDETKDGRETYYLPEDYIYTCYPLTLRTGLSPASVSQ